MRIFSNNLLTWPQVIHLHHAIHVNPRPCMYMNYNIYKIESIHPYRIISLSPLEYLNVPRHYYCYERYFRAHKYEYMNSKFADVFHNNNSNSTMLYFPDNIQPSDAIIIKEYLKN